MDFISANGIVVGETSVNEGDKLLTVFTDKFGIITARAPGAKSLKRKDMAGINMFAYGEYIFTRKKTYFTVRECNIITHFFDIKKDITAFSTGCYILEALKITGTPEQPDIDILRLALNSLYALSSFSKNSAVIKASFELKLCCLLGVMPEIESCMHCGNKISENEGIFFDMENDIVICESCIKYETETIKKLNCNTYKCIKYISQSQLSDFLKFTIDDNTLNELYDFSEKLFLRQIEFKPKTLTYLNSIKRDII